MSGQVQILIIDDNYDHVQKIIKTINNEIDANFEHATNSRDALKKIKGQLYDILIIDIQIPDELGGDINPYGGKDLLDYIYLNEELIKPTHILGITSHKDSYNDCIDSFTSMGWSLSCNFDDIESIKKIICAKAKHVISPPKSYDIAIVTALEHTELEAVLKIPCDWIPLKDATDCNIYYSGTINSSAGTKLSLIATSCHGMGIAHASAIGMKTCLKYKPKYVFMTGIAAGIKDKVQLGDILIADPCWDWGSGKQTVKKGQPIFLPSPSQLPLDPVIKGKLKSITVSRKYIDDIYNNWPSSNRPNHSLNAHLGPIATGAVVLEDPEIIEIIKSHHRELIGIEMEAYGLALATSLSSSTPPKTIIIKSVCDFADPNKNDNWHAYAAYTSTQMAFKIIVNELF
ncbi:response regulator [Desulfatiferula olefinivorans]